MAYELHKNAIITNNVNFFCLACDSFLDTEQEAYSHIQSFKHCEKLSLVSYSDKYKNHHIRKFNKGYYCTFCNVLLSTSIKVDSHILQDVHKQNRGNSLLKSTTGKIIAYDTIQIKENAWHGLNDNVCSICDTEYEDEFKHRRHPTHVLNLIQKTVKFGSNDGIYRDIDESTVHCLTCDKILALKTINVHFYDAEHLDLYETYKIKSYDAPTTRKTDETNSTDDTNPSIDRQNDNESKDVVTDILRFLDTYRRSNIDINFETGTAFCRKCWVVVDFNHGDIDNHIKKHSLDKKAEPIKYPPNDFKESYSPQAEYLDTESKNTNSKENVKCQNDKESDSVNINSSTSNLNDSFNTKLSPINNKSNTAADKGFRDEGTDVCSPSTSEYSDRTSGKNDKQLNADEALEIAKENEITYNIQNANAFCRICQVRLPSCLKSMKEHVNGAQHKKNRVKACQNKPKVENLKKLNTKRFIRSLGIVENPFNCDIIINKEIMISDFSYFLITDSNNPNTVTCALCKVDIEIIPFFKRAVNYHFRLHQSDFEEIPVIKSITSEFIREVRQGEFHCGYCNIVVEGWSEMKAHLESSDHRGKKSARLFILELLQC